MPNRCILEEPVEGTPLVVAVLFQTAEEASAQASAAGSTLEGLGGKDGGTVVTLRISYQLAGVRQAGGCCWESLHLSGMEADGGTVHCIPDIAPGVKGIPVALLHPPSPPPHAQSSWTSLPGNSQCTLTWRRS